jgi:two-component system, sensor histidine kinase RpfC
MNRTIFRKYLSDRSNSEQSQAIFRLVLVGSLLVWVWLPGDLHPASSDAAADVLLTGLATWLTLSIVIFAATRIWPAPNKVRRTIGLLADIAGTTFTLYFTGQSGAGYAGFYLLFILGDGLRYGRGYLYASQILSVLAFGQIAAFAPWWRNERPVVSGWIIVMLVLPSFISSLGVRATDTERTIAKYLTASPSGS